MDLDGCVVAVRPSLPRLLEGDLILAIRPISHGDVRIEDRGVAENAAQDQPIPAAPVRFEVGTEVLLHAQVHVPVAQVNMHQSDLAAAAGVFKRDAFERRRVGRAVAGEHGLVNREFEDRSQGIFLIPRLLGRLGLLAPYHDAVFQAHRILEPVRACREEDDSAAVGSQGGLGGLEPLVDSLPLEVLDADSEVPFEVGGPGGRLSL